MHFWATVCKKAHISDRCPVLSVCNVGVLCQTVGQIKIKQGMQVVFDGDPVLPPKKWAQPRNFRPLSVVSKRLDGLRYATWYGHINCGMEVGFSPGDLLDGNPAPPPKKGDTAPIFDPCLLWLNVWMDQEFKMQLNTEVGLGPDDIVLDGDPASPPKKQELTSS